MTTDPKALIERLERVGQKLTQLGLVKECQSVAVAMQRVHDLTAENERLTEQRDFLGAQAADLALKVGRIKALGDGLAEALDDIATNTVKDGWAAHRARAALAAWETRDEG